MRATIVLAALPMLLAALLLSSSSTSNAYATQFSFNTSSGETYKQADFTLPVAIIGIASLVGMLLVINERRKAKGIWFSNSEPLK